MASVIASLCDRINNWIMHRPRIKQKLSSQIVRVLLFAVAVSVLYLSLTAIRDALSGKPSTIESVQLFNFTLMNENLCDSNPNIIIFIHVRVQDFEQRENIRKTWMLAKNRDHVSYKVIFNTGLGNNKLFQQALEIEAKEFGDIIQGDFIDSYRNMTYKHLMGLKWIISYCPSANMIVKVDDDVIVNMNKLMQYYYLKDSLFELKNMLYCHVESGAPAMRNVNDKWYVTRDEFAPEIYPDYCAGYAYIMTPDLAKRLLDAASTTPYFWIDDIYVTGILMRKINEQMAFSCNTYAKETADHIFRNLFIYAEERNPFFAKLRNAFIQRLRDNKTSGGVRSQPPLLDIHFAQAMVR